MSPVKIGAEAILAVDREPLRDTSHVVVSGTGTATGRGPVLFRIPHETRREQHRRRLLDTRLEEIGTRGYDQITVKDVCRHAGLTERYFYEQFSDRYGPMVAIYNDVIAVVMDTLIAPTRGAAAGHVPSRKRVQAPLWASDPLFANLGSSPHEAVPAGNGGVSRRCAAGTGAYGFRRAS
jgi:AcrR family transcriptional regulator